ncbi:MAG: AAA family ATPase [Xanthomonadales bacterium]|nr:AAA family ATPase [Xanthomonadales bacterium]
MLTTLAIANYRSLRDLTLPLQALTVIAGANGSGKSNLYRALRLLAETAQGNVVGALAREGGLASTFWAGPERFSRGMRAGEVPVQGGPRQQRQRLLLGFASEDFGYAIDFGIPPAGVSAFNLDPEIKLECLWADPVLRSASVLVERRARLVRARAGRDWRVLEAHVPTGESMLSRAFDPQAAPELLALRERLRNWRFYDHFRTDPDAPARQSQLGTRTPALAHDGRDLAAALQTIREIGDASALEAAVEDAFPGAELQVHSQQGRFEIRLQQSGLLRPLGADELSDGTLRYLLWIAALLTPRPPPLMVLNEPETSLHPDLLPALGRLIADAATRTQVWVISHSPRLIASLERGAGCTTLTLEKELGETRVAGQDLLDVPAWRWPER